MSETGLFKMLNVSLYFFFLLICSCTLEGKVLGTILFKYVLTCHRHIIIFFFLLNSFKLCRCVLGNCYFVTLSDNGPVVLGANITFKAELFSDYGTSPSGNFRFRWKDNGIPQHTSEVS